MTNRYCIAGSWPSMVWCGLALLVSTLPPAPASPRQLSPSPTGALQNESRQIWHTFSSSAGRFKIDMPGTPDKQTNAVSVSSGQVVAKHAYALKTPIAGYIVAYTDYPNISLKPKNLDRGFDHGRDRMLASGNGHVVSEKKVNIGNIPGRELVIKEGTDLLMQRMYFVSGRLYQVWIIFPDPSNTPADLVKFYDDHATRFFNSFEISATETEPEGL